MDKKTNNHRKIAMDDDNSESKIGWGHRHLQAVMMFCCLVTAYSMRSSMGVALVAMCPKHVSITENITGIAKWGHRHLQAWMMFCCLLSVISIRSSLGVALVAMSSKRNHSLIDVAIMENTNNKSVNSSLADDTTISLSSSNYTNNTPKYDLFPTFEWDKKTQDTIQSSFFWGYMLLQLPAGALAHRFGAKFLLVVAILVNAVVSICLPWAAIHGGSSWMIVCRVIQGLTQACVVPSLHTLLGKWAPLQERGRISAFVHGGQALGTVVGLPLTGFIAASSQGWPGIFRFYGVLAALAGGVWALFGAESPAHHRKISQEEKVYIQLGLGLKGNGHKKHLSVPWKSILTHRGLWAIVVAHVSTSWGQITLYSQIPSYMSNVMKVDIRANGLLTALPFLVMWFFNFFYSWITDFIINKKFLSVTATRKWANTVGCWPTALCLVALAFVPPDNLVLFESILVLACSMKISAHLGFQVNHIDITPNFAGTMMSISNFVSNGVASFSPILAAYILTDVSDQYLWRYVFFVAAAIYFFTNLVYIVLGTAELAEWNDPKIPEVEMCYLEKDKNELKV